MLTLYPLNYFWPTSVADSQRIILFFVKNFKLDLPPPLCRMLPASGVLRCAWRKSQMGTTESLSTGARVASRGSKRQQAPKRIHRKIETSFTGVAGTGAGQALPKTGEDLTGPGSRLARNMRGNGHLPRDFGRLPAASPLVTTSGKRGSVATSAVTAKPSRLEQTLNKYVCRGKRTPIITLSHLKRLSSLSFGSYGFGKSRLCRPRVPTPTSPSVPRPYTPPPPTLRCRMILFFPVPRPKDIGSSTIL